MTEKKPNQRTRKALLTGTMIEKMEQIVAATQAVNDPVRIFYYTPTGDLCGVRSDTGDIVNCTNTLALAMFCEAKWGLVQRP